VLVAQARAMQSPLSAIHIHHLEGAVSRVSQDATAFGHRSARFVLNIVGTWPDPTESPAHVQWVRDTHAALTPHATGGVYVNFMADEGQDRVRAAYGPATYQRLVTLKRTYDPHNLFRLNQNITPD
jgi:FAD/FMN-containing dehydrogenase